MINEIGRYYFRAILNTRAFKVLIEPWTNRWMDWILNTDTCRTFEVERGGKSFWNQRLESAYNEKKILVEFYFKVQLPITCSLIWLSAISFLKEGNSFYRNKYCYFTVCNCIPLLMFLIYLELKHSSHFLHWLNDN